MSTTPRPTAIERLTRWAEKVPELGPAVYRLTAAPEEHKHTYHIYCPWSLDETQLLLSRYNRVDPLAAVCVMDTSTGDIRELGKTSRWECHTAARQMWLGNTGRVIYPADGAAETKDENQAGGTHTHLTIVNPDGSEQRTITTAYPIMSHSYPTADGQWLIGSTPLADLFPNNTIAPRHDKGLIRVNAESGEGELILSIEDALALVPKAARVEHCHLYMKMIVLQPHSNRVLFNLTNTFWDMGTEEPRVRAIISAGIDGSHPRYVGEITHHPNWHTIDNRIIANAQDCNGNLRLVLFDANGERLPDYVPLTKGSGHPTFSPDGALICTDGGGEEGTQVIFCNPSTGQSKVAMDCHECGGGYPTFNAIRENRSGETVMDALQRAAIGPHTWQTQRHPTWSRDGSAVLVNSDRGDGSQLYVIDVQKSLA